MKLIVSISLICGPLGAAPATAPDYDLLARIETGVICAAPSVGEAPAPGTIAGVTHLVTEDPAFISRGHRVPAVLGVGFGVKALASDAAGISAVDVTITHPPMGPTGATQQTFRTRVSGDAPSLTLYQFDHAYELLPGRWQIAARTNKVLLFSATFDILPPARLPELAKACGFTDLLSWLPDTALPTFPPARAGSGSVPRH